MTLPRRAGRAGPRVGSHHDVGLSRQPIQPTRQRQREGFDLAVHPHGERTELAVRRSKERQHPRRTAWYPDEQIEIAYGCRRGEFGGQFEADTSGRPPTATPCRPEPVEQCAACASRRARAPRGGVCARGPRARDFADVIRIHRRGIALGSACPAHTDGDPARWGRDPSDDDPWCDAQTADPEAGCAPNLLGCFATAATPALPAGPK